MDRRRTKKRVAIFSLFDLLVAGTALAFSVIFFVVPTLAARQAAAVALTADNLEPNPYRDLNIEGQAAVVIDVNTGQVLFEKNADASLPLASLTKIMTAVTALSAVPESMVVSISKDDLIPEGDSGLYADEKWKLIDLLRLTLVESSNDGAYAVATAVGMVAANTSDREVGRKAFLERMNNMAKTVGLSETYFLNPTGLDESSSEAGAYGSARDMAKLMAYAETNYPDIFRDTKYSELKFTSLSNLTHTALNTNKFLNDLPVVIASKTGYTDLAGGNLVVIFDAGFDRPIAVAVLHSSEKGRFTDVNALAWATLQKLSAGK